MVSNLLKFQWLKSSGKLSIRCLGSFATTISCVPSKNMSGGVIFQCLTNWSEASNKITEPRNSKPSAGCLTRWSGTGPASPGGDTSVLCHTRSSGSRRCPGWTASQSGLSWRNWGSIEVPASQLGRRPDTCEEARPRAREQPPLLPKELLRIKPSSTPQADKGRTQRLEGESLGSRPGYLSLYKTSYLQDSIASFSPLSDPTKTWK